MNYYKESLKALKEKVKENPNITKEEWDSYAKDNMSYGFVTLMAHMNTQTWEETKRKVAAKYFISFIK